MMDLLVRKANALPVSCSPEELRAFFREVMDAELVLGDQEMIMALVQSATKLPTAVVRQYMTDARNFVDGYGTVSTADEAADALIASLDCDEVVYADGALYTYGGSPENGGKPCWQIHTPVEVLDFVNDVFRNKPVALSEGKRREIVKLVESKRRNEGFFAEERSGVNTATCFVTVDGSGTVVQRPHVSDDRKRYVLDFGYDPNATCPVFAGAIERSLGDDRTKIDAMQELAGASLIRPAGLSDNVRFMGIMCGPAGCGKSSILKVMEALHPASSITSSPPSEWHKEYTRAMMAGATLNVVYELGSANTIKAEHFKKLGSNERVDARHPYGRPFSYVPRMYHFCATNEWPRTDDVSEGFGRRVLLIDFSTPLPEADRDGAFLDKCMAERAGILNWALEGAARLIRNGHFTIPSRQQEHLLDIQFGGDLVEEFIRTAIERDDTPGAEVMFQDIKAALMMFAKSEEERAITWNPDKYNKALAKRLAEVYGSHRRKTGGRMVYRGVRIKAEYRADLASTPPA